MKLKFGARKRKVWRKHKKLKEKEKDGWGKYN